jgi:hypothetical protein
MVVHRFNSANHFGKLENCGRRSPVSVLNDVSYSFLTLDYIFIQIIWS